MQAGPPRAGEAARAEEPGVPAPAVRVGILVDVDRVSIGADSGLSVRARLPGAAAASRCCRCRARPSVPRAAPGRLRLVETGQELETATLAAASPNELLQVDATSYRGLVEVRPAEGGKLTVVNVVNLEDYVRGVVPNELSPQAFPQIEALKAQAVAARTYALAHQGEYGAKGFDVCATQSCQVYRGQSSEQPLTDRATAETRGIVATWRGRPINAYYTSTCGGHTEDGSAVFDDAAPYLKGVACLPERSSRQTVHAALPPRRDLGGFPERGARRRAARGAGRAHAGRVGGRAPARHPGGRRAALLDRAARGGPAPQRLREPRGRRAGAPRHLRAAPGGLDLLDRARRAAARSRRRRVPAAGRGHVAARRGRAAGAGAAGAGGAALAGSGQPAAARRGPDARRGDRAARRRRAAGRRAGDRRGRSGEPRGRPAERAARRERRDAPDRRVAAPGARSRGRARGRPASCASPRASTCATSCRTAGSCTSSPSRRAAAPPPTAARTTTTGRCG